MFLLRTRLFTTLICTLLAFSAQASLESEQARLVDLKATLQAAEKTAGSFDADLTKAQAKVSEEQAALQVEQQARDAAQAVLDETKNQYEINPNPDLERKLKDDEYQVMLADRKVASAKKALARAEGKIADIKADEAKLQAKVKTAAAEVSAQEKLLEQMQSVEFKAAQKKAAEEKAKAEAEARKAAEAEAARLAEAAKQDELKEKWGIDENCLALPTEASQPSSLTALDKQVQPFAVGELRRVNRMIEEATADDVEPLAETPVLAGNKLNPCIPEQKQMLEFSYVGNGQYRLETRVLAGEQEFWVEGVVQPIRRIVQPEDNGEMYTFFLDVKYPGRYKLVGYKKALFESP